MKSATLLATLLLVTLRTDAQAVRLSTQKVDSVFIASSFVWQGAYDESKILSFLESLEKQSKAYSIVKATIYTDREDALEAERGKGVTDISKAFWESQCNEHRARARTSLQLVRIGTSQSIRIFDGAGARELLKGRYQSLSRSIDGTRLKFLSVGLITSRPMFTNRPQQTVSLFYQADPFINSITGREVIEKLQLPNQDYDIWVGSSPDFILESSYPFLNRFVPEFSCSIRVAGPPTTVWCRKRIAEKLTCGSF